MDNWPQTSESLIRRLNDQHDPAAWSQFLAIYRPVILRMAGRHGLQSADAEDLTQRVFISVARKVSDGRPSDVRAKLESKMLRPVVDETSLDGLYDFTVKFEKDASPEEFAKAFAEATGLVLSPSKRELEFTVVESTQTSRLSR